LAGAVIIDAIMSDGILVAVRTNKASAGSDLGRKTCRG